MEKMPYQPDLDRPKTTATSDATSSDWRHSLPVLVGKKVTLRELEVSDAPALFAMLTPEEVFCVGLLELPILWPHNIHIEPFNWRKKDF